MNDYAWKTRWSKVAGSWIGLLTLWTSVGPGSAAEPPSRTLVPPESSSAPFPDEIRMHSKSGMVVELNPGVHWAELMVDAKAAEEGDADLISAARDYTTLVRIFEKLRPIAAEALRRQAVVEKKLGHEGPAKVALERLAAWFPETDNKGGGGEAKRVPEKAPGEGASGVDSSAAAGGSAQQFGMSAELRRRYGLSGGEASASASATDPGAGISGTDKRATERAMLMQTRTELLAEAAKTGPELRRAQTELRRAKSAGMSRIPPTLVSDAQLRLLLEAMSLPEAFAGNTEEPKKLQIERINQAERYFHNVYLPRLELTVGLLSEELQKTRVELAQVDDELRNLAGKP